jgi:hypothetical protein
MAPGQGELTLSGPVRLRILEDGSTTSHRLGIAELTIAAHTGGPPQHRQAQHDGQDVAGVVLDRLGIR